MAGAAAPAQVIQFQRGGDRERIEALAVSLLEAAVCADADAVAAVRRVPEDAWPDLAGMRAVARAVRECPDPVDVRGILLGCVQDSDAVDLLNSIRAGVGAACNIDRVTRELITAHRDLEIRRLAEAVAEDPDRLGELIALADEPVGGDGLRLMNLINPEPAPGAVFRNGPYKKTLGVLCGRGSTGKTFLSLELAASLAVGRGLLPSFAPEGPGRAMLVLYEDHEGHVSERLEAIAGAIGPDLWEAVKDGRLVVAYGDGPLFRQTRVGETPVPAPAFEKVRATARKVKPDLLFLDPFIKSAGLASESDNASVEVVACALTRLAQDLDCAVVVSHHTTKSDSETASLNAARGGGALVDASRWTAQVTAKEGNVLLTILKDSYGCCIAPVPLARRHDGLLVEGETRDPAALVPAIARWLELNPEALVPVGAIEKRVGNGADLCGAVALAHPWATPGLVAQAASLGLETGTLSLVQKQDSGRRRKKVLSVAPTSSPLRKNHVGAYDFEFSTDLLGEEETPF